MVKRSEVGAQEPQPGAQELDLGGLGRTVSRRRWWIVGPALLCFVAALIFVSVVEPRYTGQAKVLIENGENYFTRPDKSDQSGTTLPDDEAVQSQIQLVQSRDIARQAIRRLDLTGNPDFDPLARGIGALSRVAILLGLERDPTSVSAEERILANYYDRLTVYAVPKSRVIAIEFTAADPDLAARGANTVAQLFIEAQQAAKRDAAHASAVSLGALVNDLRNRVAEADAKADQYRTESGLLLGTNSTTISAQQLGDLNTQLAQARTAQADAQAKAKLIKEMIRQNRVSEIPDVANNEFIRRISEQRSTLRADIALQSRTLLPGHPRMQELNAQLADIDTQLKAAAEKQARTLENDARIAAGRVDNLQAALDAQKHTVGTAGADQVKLDALVSQARVLKDQLEFNTAKYQEAVARETAAETPADARLFSRAVTPELPSFPKKVPIIAIATIAGLVLSLGLVVARELLSGRAFAPVDRAGEPPLVPTATLRPAPEEAPVPERRLPEVEVREVSAAAPDTAGESVMAALAAALRDARGQGRAARGLILASAGGDADPQDALTLARRLSAEGRTILVDFDQHAPAVRAEDVATESVRTLGRPLVGLSDLLAGEATFAEIIHRDDASRLHLVTSGHGALDEDATESIDLVLSALGETYDTVLMHAPPPGDALARTLARRTDVIALVTADATSGAAVAGELAAVTGARCEIVVVSPSVLVDEARRRRAA